MTLWDRRLSEQPADALMAFTASLAFDRRLAVDDLAGSRAHVRGLKRAASADTVSRGHGLLQNLRNGFSALTAAVPRPLRLTTAWAQLAALI